MLPAKSKAELQQHKAKLASSYNELLEEFSSKDLRHVGNYTLDRLIGKGSFGKVYLAKHNLTNGSKVVLKSSKKDDANLAREIHHHRQFLHPHIARLYEVIVTENLVWLVLEYCPGDELYNYLLKHRIPLEKVQKIFTQLVGAVTYIHNKSCVHRDLKLENVLLDRHENVKLCDFGFTREYDGKSNYLQTFCGTICYSAPEMIKGEKYAGEKVDVWSLGVILYALLTGELPFDDDDDAMTKQKILKEDPEYPDGFSDEAKILINKLLSKRPLYRPTLPEILSDPFLGEYAPQQQAILKLTQPAPFSTPLEKTTLERMRSAGVDIDQVIENVLSQRCDGLAGWWALLIEKEERKEKRRERKRKEKEQEAKSLRRLSAASSRLDRIAPTLVEEDEDAPQSPIDDPPRPRGRRQRRSTPQIVIPDLPQLPEGATMESPVTSPPPPPIEKDSVRSESSSRPPPPPKERHRRSSNLHVVTSHQELVNAANGVNKRRSVRRHHPIMNQLASLKHWLVESAKRARSPGKASAGNTLSNLSSRSSPNTRDSTKGRHTPTTPSAMRSGSQQTSSEKRTSATKSLTPTSAHFIVATSRNTKPPASQVVSHHQRNSLSPSPLTPRSSQYRRTSTQGLRGRKSTSSSVSSIRSIRHRHSHSKASSTSSNSIDTTPTPTGMRAASRSPHASIKILPATPTTAINLPSNVRVSRTPNVALFNDKSDDSSKAYNERIPNDASTPRLATPSGLVFARRKKSPFRGPAINTSSPLLGGPGPGTPTLKGRRGSGDLLRSSSGRAPNRRSQIIEEEEDEGEEVVEEVEAFSPVNLGKGERVHSITMMGDDAVRHELREEAH
ncbi:MAG: hypothetical protein Q9160_004713 [Pyrenula sp. 1 TL-2023]